MMKRVAVIATLFALVFPAMVSAKIVVNRGMFGVSLGETMKQARHKLGSPDIIRNEPSLGRTTWFYDRRNLLLDFRGKHRHLHGLYTENPRQRTARGVGVGSREQDVKRLVPGVQCGTTPGLPGVDCFVSSKTRSGPWTDFGIGSKGRVNSVTIGIG